MLKQFKRILLFIIVLCSFCQSQECLAEDSAISYIRVNNIADRDVEILITDKGDILVPFKQLADIFEIKYEANKAEKKISFVTFDGKEGLITSDGIYVEGNLLTKQKPKFITQGLLDGVFNEAYIPADAATSIMNAQIGTDFDSLTLVAQVDRDIPMLQKQQMDNIYKDVPNAYKNIISPDKDRKFSLNTIGLNVNAQNDNMSVEYNNSPDIDTRTFMSTAQASLNGTLLGGKYRVDLNEYYNKGNHLTFGGLTATYRNKFTTKKNKKKYFYEIGKVTGITDETSQVGTQIFGVQFWNYDIEKDRPNDISGHVKPTSMVRATINNLEPVLVSTYSGYYTLKDVKMPPFVYSLKLEEVNEDGTSELILNERYSIFGKNTPFAGEDRVTAYAGVWGYQNRLFREGKNVYKGNNKKLTAGIEYQHGYKDNLTGKTKLTFDHIYDKSDSSLIYRGLTDDALLVSGTQKNAVYLEGATLTNTLAWQSITHPALRGYISHGFSLAKDVRESSTKGGYSLTLAGEYSKDLTQYSELVGKYTKNIVKPRTFRLNGEAYYSSSDFFMAGSDSTSKNDRLGGRVGTGISFNSTSLSADYSKYISNIQKKYEGGIIDFDEARANASTRIPKVNIDLRGSGNFKQGQNHLGKNRNYNYDVYASRNLGRYLKLKVGRSENYYKTQYNNTSRTNRGYNSKYNNNYIQADFQMPKNLGYFTAGHDFISYDTDTYKNKYNMYRFGYTFPTWHHLTLGLDWGYRYHGNKGNDIGVRLAYTSKTGQTISVSYRYSKNGGYFIDNFFTPTTNNHSVNISFNDAFLVSRGLKSIGEVDLNKGIFDAIAFVDVNNNGKYDKKIDKPMKGIPITTSWGGDSHYTGRTGRVHSQGIEKGIYTVSLNMEELPFTVSPVSDDKVSYLIRIDGGKTTRLEIPLLSTVGSISGQLEVADDFNRGISLSDFIISVVDAEGKEVTYSTLTDDGEFYITGLAPGNYTVKLDKSFIDEYGLEIVPGESEKNIVIPNNYNKLTEINDIHLKYRVLD